MKKGIFYRILGLILAVTMLFGLTGFTFLAPAGTSNTIGYTMDEPGQGDQPAEPTEPTEPGQGDQGEQPTEPTEPGQGEQGDQPTEPTEPTEPGQGEQGDQDDQGTPFNPIPAPGPVDARYLLTVVQPEGGVITLAKDSGYTLDDNGTTTVNRVHQNKDGKWETTKLNFTVRAKTADEDSDEDSDEDFFKSELYAVYVNGEKVDVTGGNFTYDLANAKGSTITVTAKFYGVKNDPTPSVVGYKADGTDQVAGKWAHHRVVKFETFGFDANSASVVYKGSSDTESLANTNDVVIDNKEMTATINKEVGTDNVEFYFQIEGTVNGTSASTDSFSVTTNKIDKTAPQVKVLQSNGDDFKVGKKSYRSSYQYELSLVNSKSEKAPVSVDWAAKDKNGKNVKDCKSYNEGYNDQKYYYPLGDTFLLSGTTVELKVRQTIECNNIRCEVDKKEGKHWVEYSYIITDEAGNKAIINGGVGEETTGSIPEGNLPYDGNVYWVNGKNNIIADWKAPNLVSNWGIYFCAGKYPVDGQDGTKDIPTDNVGYTKINKDKSTEFTVEKGGSYGLYVDGRGFTLHRYYKYDPQAPEIKNVEFAKGSGLDDFVTELNGGKSILFNKSFVLNVYAIDPEYTNDDGSKVDGTDVSGIVKIEYRLIKASDVKDGKVKSNESWEVGYSSDEESPFGEVCTNEKGGTYYKVSVTKIPFDDSDKFTGYIAFRVTDLAGNETIELYEGSSKGENDEFEIVDDSILITNKSSYSGGGDIGDTGVSVSAVVEVYGNKTEWTYDAETGELVGTPVEAPYSGEWVQSATFNVKLENIGELDSNLYYSISDYPTEVKIVCEDGNVISLHNLEGGCYEGIINTSCSGKVSIEAEYNVVKYQTNDDGNKVQSESTETVTVTVGNICTVQIDHDSNTPVAYNYVEDDNGNYVRNEINGEWYNGNGDTLRAVSVSADKKDTEAPNTVYWELTYPTKGENRTYPNTARGTYGIDIDGIDIAGLGNIFMNNVKCENELFTNYFTTPGNDYHLYMFAIDEAGNISINRSLENGVYTIPLFTVNKDEGNNGTVDDDDEAENTEVTPESSLNTDGLKHYNIWWDEEAPEISVEFFDKDAFGNVKQFEVDGDERVRVAGELGFYFVRRTAEITVKDYDLTADGVKVFRGDIDPDNDITTELTDISVSERDPETGLKTYTATLTYGCILDENGNTRLGAFGDGDYNLSVYVTDVAGNVSETNTEGKVNKNNKTNENGEKVFADNVYGNYGLREDESGKFTIDQTKPVVEVSFNDKENSGVKNDKYYDGPRTMTVTIKEHNFKADDAIITIQRAESNAADFKDYETLCGKDAWGADDGDEHTIEFTFEKEGKYKVRIDVTDKAGNTLNTTVTDTTGATFEGTTAVVPEFVVDQTDPKIDFDINEKDIFGKDMECRPGYTLTDAFFSDNENHSTTPTVTLTRTVRESKGEDVTSVIFTGSLNSDVEGNLQTLRQLCADIAHDAKNDGIYTLSVRVTDLAGNESTSSVTFTVNRNGSFYEFSDDLAKLVKDYNNGIYAKKANGKYYVTEYNASDLKEGSVKIVITRDGKPIGESIVPTVGTGNIGESGLYEYVYELPNSYFEQDGVYIVEIFSDDAAGNNSKNFVEPNKESIKFVVDSVSPSINMKQGLDQSIVNGSTHTFKALVQDTYSLRSIEIKVDGKVVMRYLNQDAYNKAVENGEKNIALLTGATGEIEYTLNEKTDVQHVEIVATDMSGNVTTTATDDYLTAHESFTPDVLVSTSFWARYIHNTWALIGTGVAVAVIAAAIWFFLKKKNRSEEEAA